MNRAPYIDVLPKSYDSTIRFTDMELDLLSGTPLYASTLQVKEGLETLYEMVSRSIDSLTEIDRTHPLVPPSLSWDDFVWSYLTVSSRSFLINIDGRPVLLLAPFAGLLNHHYDAHINSKSFNSLSRCLQLVVGKSCRKGEEVFLSYRSGLSNWQLMLFYGFALDGNPFTNLEFSLDLPDDTNSIQLKSNILSLSSSLSLNQCLGYQTRLQESVQLPTELINTLRLILATDSEMKGATATKFARPLSKETEANLKITLDTFLKGLFESLPIINYDKSRDNDRRYYSWLYVKGLRKLLIEAILQARAL